MKAVLFLYPIRAYVDSCLRKLGFDKYGPEAFDWDPGWLSMLIHHRYRKQGYRINWLMLQPSVDPALNHISSMSPYLLSAKGDTSLSAGISYWEFATSHSYPDPNLILDQLSFYPLELVLGGFHLDDCVYRVAACAVQRGWPTFIDEDITDRFFETMMQDPVPLIRSTPLVPFRCTDEIAAALA